MSIQRLDFGWDGMESHPDGEYVLYADHVAAMEAEAESAHDLGVIYGINHERARIKQAVEALYASYEFDPHGMKPDKPYIYVHRVLSIIDGEES